jgi:gluconolactonase
MRRSIVPCIAGAAAIALAGAAPAAGAPSGSPAATIDLATSAGVALVRGAWRYADAKIVETAFRAPGPDRRPSGPPNRTYEVVPRAGAAAFDDSSWEAISPESLGERRSGGMVCFAWYRLGVTIPARVGDVDVTGMTAVFEIVVDDYAEVWVDGALPREIGQRGGTVVAGFNAPNRVVIGSAVHPGDRVQLAVFAINGPISDAPQNYIWVRSAKLEFHAPEGSGRAAGPMPRAIAPVVVAAEVIRADPRIDAIVPRDARFERVAEGFTFGEGPVWVAGEAAGGAGGSAGGGGGALLFSDPNENVIYRWSERDGVSVFRRESGYSGADVAEYRQPGSNGITLDSAGRLTFCEHGNRRVSRLEPDGRVTVLAGAYDRKRLNSPNDLVHAPDGTLYFTDPPFGLPKVYDDPRKELPFCGVYRVRAGTVELLARDLNGPNGIAFSPDGRFLYVANWDEARKIVMRYPVRPDGTLGAGAVFFDMTAAPGAEALDGVKVDRTGNLYVSGPGGVWIIAADGAHLGTLVLPELPANFAWGGDDARTLYMTARSGLYRVRLNVEGVRP